jgi:hypothetical protein
MAAVWAAAIAKAEEKGCVRHPIDTGNDGDDGDFQCANTPPSPERFRGPVQTQTGNGFDDGAYAHSSVGMGTVTSDLHFTSEGGASIVKQYHFAQLVNSGSAPRGGETDELIRIMNPDQRTSAEPYVSFKLNQGGSLSGTCIPIDVKTQCLNRGVRWGDVNGDGLDDFICLGYPVCVKNCPSTPLDLSLPRHD